jgi:hypothetical protein
MRTITKNKTLFKNDAHVADAKIVDQKKGHSKMFKKCQKSRCKIAD